MSKTITSIDLLDPKQLYTYADYLQWRFKDRVELIKGKLFRMSPAPSRRHQKIAFNLVQPIAGFLNGKSCEAYFAPFDVRLQDSQKEKPGDDQILTVVQPDICVICDLSKLDERGCLGAPDWIIEILSPGNNKKEVDDKFRLYEENGVKEYWMVLPGENMVNVFDLKRSKYQYRKLYAPPGEIEVRSLPGLSIDIEKIFAD